MRKGENYNTGCEPNQRPKNKKNGKKRVAHVAAVVAFLNKAKADENKQSEIKTIKADQL